MTDQLDDHLIDWLRIKRLARKTALQRGKLRWTQQSEQRLCKPRAGAWPAPLLLVFHVQRRCMSSCSGGCTYVVLLRLRTGCARGGTCTLQHVKIRFLKSVASVFPQDILDVRRHSAQVQKSRQRPCKAGSANAALPACIFKGWSHTSKCRLTFCKASRATFHLCPDCFLDSLLTPLPAQSNAFLIPTVYRALLKSAVSGTDHRIHTTKKSNAFLHGTAVSGTKHQKNRRSSKSGQMLGHRCERVMYVVSRQYAQQH